MKEGKMSRNVDVIELSVWGIPIQKYYKKIPSQLKPQDRLYIVVSGRSTNPEWLFLSSSILHI